jgi:DNA-binding NarL/FixJ family response regulator
MDTIKVALVEDNGSLRKRFKDQFSIHKDLDCVAVFASGEAAIDRLKKLPPSRIPEVILMDIGLPEMNGIETTIAVKELFPDVDVLMLTVFEDETRIFESIKAGASGYILKEESFDVIAEAIRELRRGGAPMSPSIAQKVLTLVRTKPDRHSTGLSNSRPGGGVVEFDLSVREREILDEVVNGGSYVKIAQQLSISPQTVKTHLKNIYKKLHVHTRATAVRIALERRLV